MSIFKILCEILLVCEILTPEYHFKPQIAGFYLVHIWNYHIMLGNSCNLNATVLFLFCEMSRHGKSIETGSRLVVTRDRSRGGRCGDGKGMKLWKHDRGGGAPREHTTCLQG